MIRLKLIILTQEEPFYLPYFFEKIFPLAPEVEILAIYLVSKNTNFLPIISEANERLQLYGAVGFFGFSLKYIALKSNALLRSSRSKDRHRSVSKVFTDNGIPVGRVADINDREFFNRLSKFSVDLIVSVACPQILKKPLLELPCYGCLNVHMGPLPKYRGRQPLFWALFNREKETAVTVHFMDRKLDNGPIIAQRWFPIHHKDTVNDLYERGIPLGAMALRESLSLIYSRNYEFIQNPIEKATVYGFPDKMVCKAFRKRGGRFF